MNENNLTQNEQTDFSTIENERNSTNLPKQTNKKTGISLIVIGLILIAIFLLPKIFGEDSTEEESNIIDDSTVSIESKNDFNFKISEPKKDEIVSDKKVFSEELYTQSPEKPPFLLGAPDSQDFQVPRNVPKSNKNFMIKISGNTSLDGSQANTGDLLTDNAINQAETMLGNQGSSSNASNDDIFKAPAFHATQAKKSKFNPHLLLSQGTLIPCSLRGRLVSNISGQISCTIADNVYSQSGSVLLIEKGSRVNGYYQGNSAQHGSNEIFAVWQEIRTPENLIIPLMSGSTDELGANGLSGWADNHFWDRFKNAIMLSMFKDAMGILSNRASKSGNYDYSENTREGSEDIAKTVLDQMGDIRPTIYKNQGDKVGIFVARDIDFSNVYKLSER